MTSLPRPHRPIRLGAAVATLALLAALAGCSVPVGGSAGQPGAGASSGSGDDAGSGSGGSGGGSGSTPKAASGGGSAGIDVAKIDPCVLFPKDAAQTLVGANLSDPVDAKDQTQPSCTYNPDPSGGPTAQATLSLGPGAKNFYNIDANQGHTFTDVPGLGDEAHLEYQAIFWTSHGTWAEINMLRLVDDQHQFDQALIDAAKAVDAQLVS